MKTVESYKDLDVWQQGMTLVENCYRETALFPASERFGLTMQLRKAAVSIPSNIAEGHCRTTPTFLHHISIALGSQAELETQLEIARRLGFLPVEMANRLRRQTESVGKLLYGLHRSIEPKVR